MSEVKIEVAKSEDVSDIAKIAYQTGKKHEEILPNYFKPSNEVRQKHYLQEAIEGQYSEIFKAVFDDKIVGYLVLYIWDHPAEYFVYPEYGFVGSIGVDEKYRNRGIGTSLIRAAENWCKEHNIGAIDIDVFVFNQNAERLYANLGYEEIKHYRRKILK